MGTILASKLIADAQLVLQDKNGVRWTPAELLSWLNAAQREIVIFKPTAFVKNLAVKLVAGTKQTLPADAVQFMDITRNMGVDGVTPGRAVRLVERETLDAARPGWHTDTASATVRHFIYNPLDPLTVYVYPPQPAAGQGYVEQVYGASPADVATANDPITLGNIYASAMTDYMLYRAFLKDSEYADANRAGTHRTAFNNAIAGKATVENAVEPNRMGQPPTKPPLQGA